MGTESFPGVKRPGRGVDHPPPYSPEVKERVQLHIYSASGPSWPVKGRILLYFTLLYFTRRVINMLLSSLKQIPGCHGFKDDREVETFVTGWLIAQDTNWCQQTEKLVPRYEKRGADYGRKSCDSSRTERELFLLGAKILVNNPKYMNCTLGF